MLLAFKTFVNVWKKCLPDIVFITPRTDICVYCEKFRSKLKEAVTEEEKVIFFLPGGSTKRVLLQ